MAYNRRNDVYLDRAESPFFYLLLEHGRTRKHIHNPSFKDLYEDVDEKIKTEFRKRINSKKYPKRLKRFPLMMYLLVKDEACDSILTPAWDMIKESMQQPEFITDTLGYFGPLPPLVVNITSSEGNFKINIQTANGFIGEMAFTEKVMKHRSGAAFRALTLQASALACMIKKYSVSIAAT